jgi:hypothetical protein
MRHVRPVIMLYELRITKRKNIRVDSASSISMQTFFVEFQHIQALAGSQLNGLLLIKEKT